MCEHPPWQQFPCFCTASCRHLGALASLVRAFQGHQPITELDLHLDHVLEHVFFSCLRAAKTPYVTSRAAASRVDEVQGLL